MDIGRQLGVIKIEPVCDPVPRRVARPVPAGASNDDAPDAIEPAVGWRVWIPWQFVGPPRLGRLGPTIRGLPPPDDIVGPTARAFRLHSVSGAYWPRWREMRSRCLLAPPLTAGHCPPVPGCTCGLFAFDSPAHLVQGIHARIPRPIMRGCRQLDLVPVSVIGEVALWGRVIVCERGFRAEYAYPRRIWLVRRSLWLAHNRQLHKAAETLTRYRVPILELDRDARAALTDHEQGDDARIAQKDNLRGDNRYQLKQLFGPSRRQR